MAATAALLPISTPAAEAAVGGYSATVTYIGGGDYINVRTSPSRSASIITEVKPGTPLQILCQGQGGPLGFSPYAGNSTWDRTTIGWVHDVLTTTPGGPRAAVTGGYVAYSNGIPRCDASGNPPAATVTRESKATDWARAQIGATSTTLTPDRMWSGWCETLVEQAFGTSGRYASALANYNAQLAAGRLHKDTAAPAGALVFYSWGTLGHVGISLGNGQVVSTQGTTTPMPVRQHGITAIGLPYLGWSYAPSSWPGRP